MTQVEEVATNLGTISSRTRFKEVMARHYPDFWQNQDLSEGDDAGSPDEYPYFAIELASGLDLIEAKLTRPERASVDYEFSVETLGEAINLSEAVRGIGARAWIYLIRFPLNVASAS